MNSQEQKFQNFVNAVEKVVKPTQEQVAKSIETIRDIVKKYVAENNLKSLVIGVSGGLDSAVVAAICQEKYIGVPLIGISIPISSSNSHREQAKWVGDTYCSSFMELTSWENKVCENSIFDMVSVAVNQNNKAAIDAGFAVESFDNNILQGNIKARLRMITLYDLARKTGGCVVGTSNFSEYWVGFWTLQGDVSDISPIEFVDKGIEEQEIAKYLGIRDDIISQKPSDGLNVTEEDSDEAQLGITYREMTGIMFIEEGIIKDPELIAMYNEIKDLEKVQNIIKRNKATQFKRDGCYMIKRSENMMPISF